MGNRKILQFPLAQLLADRAPVTGGMQIKPQQISFTTLPLTDVARLVMPAGAAMPTLAP